MSVQNDGGDDWYRQWLVWLLIAIPGLTVIGCMLTIFLAISHPDEIVKEPVQTTPLAARVPRDALP